MLQEVGNRGDGQAELADTRKEAYISEENIYSV